VRLRVCEGGSTHESSKVITGAVPTDSIDDLLCHCVAVEETRNSRFAEAEVKGSRIDVAACRIKGVQVSGTMKPARYHIPLAVTCTFKSRGAQTSSVLLFA